MKIAVVGATGNIGSRTVDAALGAGHEVVAYVRRPEAVQARDHLTVVKGAIDDVPALTTTIEGADAVIVAITGPSSQADFMQTAMPSIVAVMQQSSAARLVLVSAFGSGDTADKASWFMRLIYRSVLGKFMADKAASEKLLVGSGIDYTIVYPVNLKDAPARPAVTVKPLAEVAKVPGLPTLPFANVAQALVDIAEHPTATGSRLLITTAK